MKSALRFVGSTLAIIAVFVSVFSFIVLGVFLPMKDENTASAYESSSDNVFYTPNMLGSSMQEVSCIYFNMANTFSADTSDVQLLSSMMLGNTHNYNGAFKISLFLMEGKLGVSSASSYTDFQSLDVILIFNLVFEESFSNTNVASLRLAYDVFTSSNGNTANFTYRGSYHLFDTYLSETYGRGADIRIAFGSVLHLVENSNYSVSGFDTWRGYPFIFGTLISRGPISYQFNTISTLSDSKFSKAQSANIGIYSGTKDYDIIRSNINNVLSKYFTFGYKQTINFSDNYQSGYNEGWSDGSLHGYDEGYQDGHYDGKESVDTQYYYDQGYYKGHSDGVANANDYSFMGLIGAVVDAPLNAFKGMFNFDVLGVNLSGLMLSLFTLCIVIVVVKLVLGRM